MLDHIKTINFSTAPAALPHSREAEEAVIGSVLINPEAYYDVAEFLQSGDFYIHRNQRVWDAFTRLQQRRVPVDLLTVVEEIERMGWLAEIGGSAYLTALINQVPSSLNAESYGRIVEGHSIRRRMINAANKIATLAYDESVDTTASVEKSVTVFEDAVLRKTDYALTPISSHLSAAYDRIDAASRTTEIPGTPTGLIDLDRKLGNLKRGELYVVAGRPGKGKTSFMLTAAKHASSSRKRVAVFSLEMSNEKITNRLLAQETGIDVQLIDTGKVADHDWPLLTQAIESMSDQALFLDDTPAITPLQIKTKCRRLMMMHGPLDLVVVDYLQLMGVGDEKIRVDNRTQEIGYFTRALKQLSKDLNVPILIGAQLSRAVEQRVDKRPQLSDLRESGDIESDADVVMFLHNDPGIKSASAPTELIIAKHRNGPEGTVEILFKSLTQDLRTTKRDPDAAVARH